MVERAGRRIVRAVFGVALQGVSSSGAQYFSFPILYVFQVAGVACRN